MPGTRRQQDNPDDRSTIPDDTMLTTIVTTTVANADIVIKPNVVNVIILSGGQQQPLADLCSLAGESTPGHHRCPAVANPVESRSRVRKNRTVGVGNLPRTVNSVEQVAHHSIEQAAVILEWAPTTLRDAISRRQVPHHRRHAVRGIFLTDSDIDEIRAGQARTPARPLNARRHEDTPAGEPMTSLEAELAAIPMSTRRRGPARP